MNDDTEAREGTQNPPAPPEASTTPSAPRQRNWPSVTVHLVWALAFVAALCTPIFFMKSFRAENRSDVDALARGVGRAFFRQDVTQRFFGSVSAVGEGRLLELAQLRTHETLTETLSRNWLGLDMQSTVRLDAPVIYRYGVRWDTGWQITLTAGADSLRRVCLVDAPPLEPFQPPTVDTSGFLVATEEQILGPDTGPARDALLRRFTPHVSRIATTPEYRAIVRELARKTLVDYVEQWLLNSRLVDPGTEVTVYARFADDTPDSLRDRALEYEKISFR